MTLHFLLFWTNLVGLYYFLKIWKSQKKTLFIYFIWFLWTMKSFCFFFFSEKNSDIYCFLSERKLIHKNEIWLKLILIFISWITSPFFLNRKNQQQNISEMMIKPLKFYFQIIIFLFSHFYFRFSNLCLSEIKFFFYFTIF